MKIKSLLISLLSLAATTWASPSVLLINDTTDHYHWGCTATSTALKEEIQGLGYSLEAIRIRDIREAKNVPEDFDKFSDRDHFELFQKTNPDLISRLNSHDYIVFNGEGSIHMNRPLPRSLLYTAYISKVFLKKHVEIINHSCFPEDKLTVDDEVIKTLYSEVYKKLDYVSVREPLSKQAMNSIGVSVDLSFDSMPLYIQKHYTPQKIKQEKNIVLAGSVAWREEGLFHIVNELKKYEKQGYKIKVLIGAKDHPARDDRLFVEYLKEKLESGWELVDAKSMTEWLDTINNADLLVSGRFHHTIAAICLKTPFVALNSNTPKVEGMLSIMPQKVNVLRYSDSDLQQKLQLSIKNALQMSEKDFPSLDEICQKALVKFSALKSQKVSPILK